MRPDVLQLAADLSRRGEPFALATVVRREPPSSARVGDGALITAGGAFHGWLGGSCTQPTVVQIAIQTIRESKPALIALSPTPGEETRHGVTPLLIGCHSGGSVDIYIEPVLPAPRLLVFGVSPTAQALARLGKQLGYVVEAIDPVADHALFPEVDRVVTNIQSPELAQRSKQDPLRLYAVVATLGERDAEAIASALALNPAYVGVVASRKRFTQVRDVLHARGVDKEDVERIKSPAGLDIGAVAPAEIALSILAEIVQLQRTRLTLEQVTAADASTLHIDPVCGMSVDPNTTQHRMEHADKTYYFCCGSCREQFLANPVQFTSVSEG